MTHIVKKLFLPDMMVLVFNPSTQWQKQVDL